MLPPMKITRDTPDQLIIADVPWLLGIGLIIFILTFAGIGLAVFLQGEWMGLLFLLIGGGIGLLAFAAFVRRVQVICDRVAGTVTIRRKSLFGYSEVQHDLRHLSKAVLESTTGSKGGTLYRPVLVLDGGMSKGRHPIVEAYTNMSGPGRAVDAVNSWLGAARVDSAAQTS